MSRMTPQRMGCAGLCLGGGLMATWLLGTAAGGGFVEATPGVIIFVPIILGPAFVGFVLFVVLLANGMKKPPVESGGEGAPRSSGPPS